MFHVMNASYMEFGEKLEWIEWLHVLLWVVLPDEAEGRELRTQIMGPNILRNVRNTVLWK